jgi:hypothetical protein
VAGAAARWDCGAALWEHDEEIDASVIGGIGDQLGFINVNTSCAGDAELEQRIVTEVASYRRQFGRVLECA